MTINHLGGMISIEKKNIDHSVAEKNFDCENQDQPPQMINGRPPN